MRIPENTKRTPQKRSSPYSSKKRIIDDILAKDLLISPFKDTITNNLLTPYTPLRKQPEYLLSPSPVKKDLFSQLLGTQTKQNTPLNYDSSIMQEDMSYEQQSMMDQSLHDSQEMEDEKDSDNSCNWSDQNGAKKRKRKSTTQIKILKQGIEGQLNWTKQKIMKMAQITGLSQSQVYKWCWDQKKKQNKSKYSHHCFDQKRKFIRKDISYRNNISQNRHRDLENSYQYLMLKEADIKESRNTRDSLTKQKASFKLDEQILETQKKLNKRLIFN